MTPKPDLTPDDCWSAIYSLADNYLADRIEPQVIAKLIATGFVARGSTGLPELTDKGRIAHKNAVRGEERVEEIEFLPPKM